MKFVLDQGYLQIVNSAASLTTTLTDYVKGLTINPARDEIDVSAWDLPAHQYIKGPGNNSMTINLFLPEDHSGIYFELFKHVQEDSLSTFTARFKSAVASSTNLQFTGSVVVKDIPSGGDWGSAHETTLNWNISGQVSIYDGTTTVTI